MHTPLSTSHARTVASSPQLTAPSSPAGVNTALDTRAVWLLSTPSGALRFALASPSATRRLLRRSPGVGSSGTSSVVGTAVSQSPMRPSHPAVSRCAPDKEEEIEASGPVCRWSVALVWKAALGRSAVGRVRRVSAPVRSCEAVATKTVDSSVELGVGMTAREVTAAEWTGAASCCVWL